jgi:hypothetical protein
MRALLLPRALRRAAACGAAEPCAASLPLPPAACFPAATATLAAAAAAAAAARRTPHATPHARRLSSAHSPPLAAACWSVRARASSPQKRLRACVLVTASALTSRPPRLAAQCGAARRGEDLYFCGACRVILPADEAHDFFALLSSPRRFDLTPSALEHAFKEAQKALHPDKFAARPEARARTSVTWKAPARWPNVCLVAPPRTDEACVRAACTAGGAGALRGAGGAREHRVRRAARAAQPSALPGTCYALPLHIAPLHTHTTLPSHPHARSSPRLLLPQLQLQGASPPGGHDGEGTLVAPALLAEVMDAREEAEDARGDARALDALAARAADSLAACEAALGAAFAAGDATAAAAATTRLSYLTKLAEDIAESRHAAAAAAAAADEAARHASGGGGGSG